MTEYLKIAERKNLLPNFWMSEEYFQKAELQEMSWEGWVWWEEDGWAVVPPISLNHPLGEIPSYFSLPIWSDFPEFKPHFLFSEFLDYEYIYDPKHFENMEGGKWKIFRKNSRKWPRENPGSTYIFMKNKSPFQQREINKVGIQWLQQSQEDIQDGEVLLKYIWEGKNQKGLYVKDQLVGVNIWDENYYYINFRFCICNPEPFLSEYMRFLFYSDIAHKNKLVNDGGVLDKESLKKFKDKLNPISIRKVKSWKREES